MSKKKHDHEEHVDETWLIPYADMLTLLLALFIVMFASASMDNEKFDQMKSQFSTIFSDGSGLLESPSDAFNINNSPGFVESQKMEQILEQLNEQLENSEIKDKITVTISKDGLEISIQDGVLFASGDANILPNVSPILSSIARSLRILDNNIRIVGHTDNVPISTAQFKSNWELSAIRSINVMNYLIDEGSLNPKRFIIQGHGEYQPKYNNNTTQGRAGNRRVEIVVVRKHPLSNEEIKVLQSQSGGYFYRSSDKTIQ